MSKYSVKELWDETYGKNERVHDYAGRLMLKSACGNPHSAYQPTIDHIRPISKGGKNVKSNIVICHWETNEEKGDFFPHWQANGHRFHAKKTNSESSGYQVVKEGGENA